MYIWCLQSMYPGYKYNSIKSSTGYLLRISSRHTEDACRQYVPTDGKHEWYVYWPKWKCANETNVQNNDEGGSYSNSSGYAFQIVKIFKWHSVCLNTAEIEEKRRRCNTTQETVHKLCREKLWCRTQTNPNVVSKPARTPNNKQYSQENAKQIVSM